MAENEVSNDPRGGEREKLSDAEIVELFERYSPSVPVRIPVRKLSTEYEYRFINRKNPNTYTRRRGVGWEPMTEAMLVECIASGVRRKDLHIGTHETPDGYIGVSDDLVLARIPRRYAEAYRASMLQKNQDRLRAGKRRFHQAGEMLGVTTEEKFNR